MRAGDLVELRRPGDILATLDSSGCNEGLPFMPEMLAYYGHPFRVAARLERACDTHTWSGVRRFKDTVVLDDLRCDGSAHERCDARCRIFWREAWLRPADDDDAHEASVADDPAYAELVRRTQTATTRRSESELLFRCQATELLRASTPVPWWSPLSFLRELRCGNVGLRRLVRVLSGAVGHQFGRKVLRRPLGPPANVGHPVREPGPALQPGDRMRVCSRLQIANTLDDSGTNRGLRFDFPEMGPYCGKAAPVLLQVKRFIDEPTGKMVELRSDAYILDGFACSGDHSTKRWFCPRAIYAWWRGCWLEPVDVEDRGCQTLEERRTCSISSGADTQAAPTARAEAAQPRVRAPDGT